MNALEQTICLTLRFDAMIIFNAGPAPVSPAKGMS
jgi:hypothetical protein